MADLNKIIDELSTLTVVEAAELSKQLEEKWGVTAAAAVAAAPTTGSAGAAPAEEKDEFTIMLTSACLLYTSPSPRDQRGSRMPSSA